MKLSSRIDNLALIYRTLKQVKKEHGIGEVLFLNILSSVNEAFVNAVRHGNRCDPSRTVSFEYRLASPEQLVFKISDEGEGFNWRKPVCLPERSEEEGGRGLFIIDRLSDKHRFNQKGNHIELYFTL